jgi:hypothetical protein
MTGESSVGRWLAEAGRRPGARLIWSSFLGLAALAAAAFYVSFRAQFAFMFGVKHQDIPALVEAVIPDAGMVICSLLALGMACAGHSARVARLLVVVFAGLSAGMNYLAADVTSFRSVAVYVMPPAAFAVCTDVAVSVVRRHGLGIREDSAWAVLGRAMLAAARLAGVILLYSLRFILAPAETAKGLRRTVLDAAPLPGARQDHPAPEALPEAAPEVILLTPEAIPGSAAPAPEAAPEATAGAALHAVPEVTGERPRKRPSDASEKQPGPATPERLQEHYAQDLAAGQVPSIRQIRREWPVGYDRARELYAALAAGEA